MDIGDTKVCLKKDVTCFYLLERGFELVIRLTVGVVCSVKCIQLRNLFHQRTDILDQTCFGPF